MINGWPLAGRIARRELRGSLKGIGVFLACLILGVASIAGIGSLQSAIFKSLEMEGQTLLGGDIDLELTHTAPDREQWTYLEKNSEALSLVAQMRTVARTDKNERRSLVELKAVDRAYPLYGEVALRSGQPLGDAIAADRQLPGAVVEESLLERLGLAVGDMLKIGTALFIVNDIIENEPDRTTQGLTLGPRVMISSAALPDTGLVTEGSLVNYHVKVALPPSTALDGWSESLTERFPDAGWDIDTRENAAPGIERFINRLGVFLTLVALTALLVGGVGIANGVHTYLSAKTATIATLKCVGATGAMILRIYLIQVLFIGLSGIAAGVILGGIAPFLIGGAVQERLAIPIEFGLYPEALAIAAIFGLLIVLAFSLWPLGRARAVPPASLFRSGVQPLIERPGRGIVLAITAIVIALAVLAVIFSRYPEFTAWFILGALGSFALLFAAGHGMARLAHWLSHGRHRLLRMGLASMDRPGAATISVMLSLGLGLTLLAGIALIEVNLSRQVAEQLPERAPAFFFIDIQKHQAEKFDAIVRRVDGASNLERVPMLRGHIIRIDGVPVAEAEIAPEARWAVRGDRGFTYAAMPPDGTKVVAGEWWPQDYNGPALFSFDADLARGFGLDIGDTITVNALGREITAELANVREIEWDQMGINFTFVFSPGVLNAAPHTYLATVEAAPEPARKLYNAVTDALPNVTPIDVRAVLAAINKILGDVGTAVRLTGLVAILAGIFVLAGALAAGYRVKLYEAAILKVMGARRREILSTWLVEYALLGLSAALIAGVLGTLAAWIVVERVMQADFTFYPGIVLMTLAGACVITVVLGLAASWRALDKKPMALLRNE